MQYLNSSFSVPMGSSHEHCESCHKTSDYYVTLNGVKQCFDCYKQHKFTLRQKLHQRFIDWLYKTFID